MPSKLSFLGLFHPFRAMPAISCHVAPAPATARRPPLHTFLRDLRVLTRTRWMTRELAKTIYRESTSKMRVLRRSIPTRTVRARGRSMPCRHVLRVCYLRCLHSGMLHLPLLQLLGCCPLRYNSTYLAFPLPGTPPPPSLGAIPAYTCWCGGKLDVLYFACGSCEDPHWRYYLLHVSASTSTRLCKTLSPALPMRAFHALCPYLLALDLFDSRLCCGLSNPSRFRSRLPIVSGPGS